MKFFKKALVLLCFIALLSGTAAYLILRPIAMPGKRDIFFESMPEQNALRTSYQVDGVGGSRFFIQSPKADALNAVSVAQFGAGPDVRDNTEALNNAFVYCKEHPGTRLVFEKEVYYVSGELHFWGIKDAYIDAEGAKILYDNRDGLVTVYDCECLEIRGLSFDWDWDKKPLGATARAVEVKGEKNTVDFVFDVPEYARADMLYAITECDEESDTYGAKGTLIEFYDEKRDEFQSITKISDNTLRVVHKGALSRFGGKKFILRSDAYGGSIFRIERSRHVTLDGVNLYGGTGMGIIVGGRSSHFALRNIFIGPDPKYADVRCISLDADAVHINDAEGCFIIENCDFSRQGDDDVNINSGIGIIKKVENRRTILIAADGSMDTEPGDVITFRDEKFHLLGFTAVVESCEGVESKLRRVTFRNDLPDTVKKDCMLFNAEYTGNNYVIRNNYFHEHRARGLLLQTSDGLVENNVFYKTCHDAIRIVMDISDGLWHEGTGADNIEIRNNTFIECGVIGTEVIEIGTHINGKGGRAYAFTNIRIENNEFRDICGNLLLVNNVNNLVFSGNKITVGNVYRQDIGQGRSYFMRDCANVSFSDNVYTDVAPLSFTKIIRSDDPFLWARLNINALRGKGGAE